jgi:ABC-2 type transport system permease protein
MVPRFIMPETMQTIGLITPHAWAIEGYHDVIVRDKGLVDVLPAFAALLAFAVVFFAVGAARFRYQFTD